MDDCASADVLPPVIDGIDFGECPNGKTMSYYAYLKCECDGEFKCVEKVDVKPTVPLNCPSEDGDEDEGSDEDSGNPALRALRGNL